MRFLFFVMILVFSGCKQRGTRIVDRYPNGQVMTEYIYANKKDTLNYTCKVYYENGSLKHETQIVSGMFVGEKKTYAENGGIQRIERLSRPTEVDDSTYDCYVINFGSNGSKESEYQYANGEINGLTIEYDSVGKKRKTSDYVDGKLHGKVTSYDQNGRIKRTTFLQGDSLSGFDILFRENGDTAKWFHSGDFGFNGVFYKKWLDNGLTITGNYGDRDRSFVVWKWWDSSDKMVKSKVVRSKDGEYIAPE